MTKSSFGSSFHDVNAATSAVTRVRLWIACASLEEAAGDPVLAHALSMSTADQALLIFFLW